LREESLGEDSRHHDPLDDVLRALQGREAGLSAEEAQARLGLFGPNVLPRAEPLGPLRIFLRQFKNPLVYLLLVATLISLFIGELLDALFIFIVLLCNAAIGTVQEWQAQKQARELDESVPHRVIARRSGLWVDLAASRLVPGDVVKLETGTKVSADLRLIRAQDLVLDESLLTGESVPVGKQARAAVAVDAPLANRANMLFAGTTVLSGRTAAVVVAASRETEIGKIAAALSEGEGQPPPLILQLERFSRLIGLIAAAQAAQGTPLVTVLTVDLAFLVFAAKLDLDAAALRRGADGVSSIPYEPERRYAATFVSDGGRPAAPWWPMSRGRPKLSCPCAAISTARPCRPRSSAWAMPDIGCWRWLGAASRRPRSPRSRRRLFRISSSSAWWGRWTRSGPRRNRRSTAAGRPGSPCA
jgi:magnesium-transporting ATPase (P-type)